MKPVVFFNFHWVMLILTMKVEDFYISEPWDFGFFKHCLLLWTGSIFKFWDLSI